jgi:hypothetical protein
VPIVSIGASAAAIIPHFAGPNPELATILTATNPVSSRVRRNTQIAATDTPGADKVAQFLLGAVAADRVRRMTIEHLTSG